MIFKKLDLLLAASIPFILFSTLIYADTNGIWNRAEDLRGGEIGSDETEEDYVFQHPVLVNNSLEVEGELVIAEYERASNLKIIFN